MVTRQGIPGSASARKTNLEHWYYTPVVHNYKNKIHPFILIRVRVIYMQCLLFTARPWSSDRSTFLPSRDPCYPKFSLQPTQQYRCCFRFYVDHRGLRWVDMFQDFLRDYSITILSDSIPACEEVKTVQRYQISSTTNLPVLHTSSLNDTRHYQALTHPLDAKTAPQQQLQHQVKIIPSHLFHCVSCTIYDWS